MSLKAKISWRFHYLVSFSIFQEQNYVEITELQPNSMYFLQVQTISQYGQNKLRSNRASIFYNTTGEIEPTQRIGKQVIF
jgi:hypothetical protein